MRSFRHNLVDEGDESDYSSDFIEFDDDDDDDDSVVSWSTAQSGAIDIEFVRSSGLGSGGRGGASSVEGAHHNEDEEDDEFFDFDEDERHTSASLPIVKDLMKRLLRTSKALASSLAPLSERSGAPSDAAEAVAAAEGSAQSRVRARAFDLYMVRLHYFLLWSRLLRLIVDEYDHCSDVYASSLDMQDRLPFESLTHAIHHNTDFCDAMGQIINAKYAFGEVEEEETEDELRPVIRQHRRDMEKIQIVATCCGFFVVEGTHESFLDPTTMYDVCRSVIHEPVRRKRLISLSLMFSMLDQDEQSLMEALSQSVHKVLLQRLRHLVHARFGPFKDTSQHGRPARGESKSRASRSPLLAHVVIAGSGASSDCSSLRRGASPSLSTASPMRSAHPSPCSLLPLQNARLSSPAMSGYRKLPCDCPDSPQPITPSIVTGRSAVGSTFPAVKDAVLDETGSFLQKARKSGEVARSRHQDQSIATTIGNNNNNQIMLPSSTLTHGALAGGNDNDDEGMESTLPKRGSQRRQSPGRCRRGGGVSEGGEVAVRATSPELPAAQSSASTLGGKRARAESRAENSSMRRNCRGSEAEMTAAVAVSHARELMDNNDDFITTAAHEQHEHASSLYDAWTPAVGDYVARGPEWQHGEQGRNCDFGRVVGFLEGDYVIVQWILSPDAPGYAPPSSSTSQQQQQQQGGLTARSHIPPRFDCSTSVTGEPFFPDVSPSTQLYKYRYSATHAEVVHWRSYKLVKTMEVSKDTLRSLELMLVCAVAGVLCQQKDTILAALQFQAVDSAVHVLQSMDIGATQHSVEAMVEAVEARARARLARQRAADGTAPQSHSHADLVAAVPAAPVTTTTATTSAHNDAPNTGVVQDKAVGVLLSWDVPLQAMRRRFRDERELFARIGWVLNALLMHKKLALIFLHSGGVPRVLHFMDSSIEVCSLYGCCIILSHIAKVSIMEELLRTQEQYFDPMMRHILHQWQKSPSTDVQASAGSFLFHAMSFPCVLHYVDQVHAPSQMITTFERNLATSKEHFDVIHANVQLAIFRCLNIYLIAHLMLATRVIFRKHRVLSGLVTRSVPTTSLPRDPATVDAVLGFLCAPSPELPDVSAENIASLLTPDRLTAVHTLVQQALTETLLRGVSFYFQQNRWELLAAGLQALCVLTVVPFVRPLLVQPNTPDLGIAQLLVIVNDWANTFHGGGSGGSGSNHHHHHHHNTINGSSNTFRETHLQPCVVAALQILINVTTPPLDSEEEAGVANFNNACGALRAGGGLRVLLEVLRITKPDVSMSAKLHLFPLVARAAQLLVVLRRFKDTVLLFDAMGVHRVAQDLVLQYKNVQREYISMMATRKLHTELDPAGRFMENVKSLMFSQPAAASTTMGVGGGEGEIASLELTKVVEYTTDPVEMEQRQGIIGNAIVDYSKQSLLELIARHLDGEGYGNVAHMLRQESHLCNSSSTSHRVRVASQLSTHAHADKDTTSSNNHNNDSSTAVVVHDGSGNGNLSLDALVRSFLRQQQESCLHPIETLPQFDLTRRHVYVPAPPPLDDTRHAFHRQLAQRMGARPTLRRQVHAHALTYRYPAFMFDITGGGEGLDGQSMAFCDDGESILLGTADGAMAVFDTFPEESSEDKLLEQHLLFDNAAVSSLVVSHDGTLVAAINDAHAVKLMPRHSLPVIRHEMAHCRAVRFSGDGRLLLGTSHEEDERFDASALGGSMNNMGGAAAACRVYDLTTGEELRRFHDRAWSIENADNVAVFDHTAQLVLHNAVLWDVRCSEKPVLRFDRVTESFASIFHPLLHPLVIIDEKVWDVRMVRMVHTVPTFHKTTSFHVSEAGRVMYSFRASVGSGAHASRAMVSAVETVSMEAIFSEEMRPPFSSFAVDPSDRYCAAILQQDVESVVRLFSVSSGPFPAEHGAFTVMDPRGEDAAVEDEDEEDSIGDNADMDSDFYDDDDEEDDDEEEEDEEEHESNAATSEESHSTRGNSSRSSDGTESSDNYADSESELG